MRQVRVVSAYLEGGVLSKRFSKCDVPIRSRVHFRQAPAVFTVCFDCTSTPNCRPWTTNHAYLTFPTSSLTYTSAMSWALFGPVRSCSVLCSVLFGRVRVLVIGAEGLRSRKGTRKGTRRWFRKQRETFIGAGRGGSPHTKRHNPSHFKLYPFS